MNRAEFQKLAKVSWKFKAFMLKELPLGLIAGLRVEEFTDQVVAVSIPFNYRTKNPFKSMYFAAQSMAAEMSTALMAMSGIHQANPPVSMLVFDMKAHFSKKARTRITFTTNDGMKIFDAVKKAQKTGEGVAVEVNTIGRDTEGDVVSEFTFVWTFKVKS